MKLDLETIKWFEKKIFEISNATGFGYVALIYHIKKGKVDYKEKIARETEKDIIKVD